MDDPFSPAGRFDERRRQADQQRALEVKVKREQEATMGIVERLRDPVNNWNSGGRFAAADHIEALEASVVGLTQERDFHRETADLHAERITRAADLIERLKGYAVHGKACPVRWQQPGDCRCGLTALIKEIEGE